MIRQIGILRWKFLNLSLFTIFLSCYTVKAQQQKPNIVIIISDDHSYQTISAYGAKYGNTPQIDRLAKEGAVFENAFVNNSICGPSRATLLTGKYSHKNGFKDNETSHFDFNQNLFVKDLQGAGYQTAWIGKIHLGHQLQGFNYYNILDDQGHYFNPDFISKDGKVRHEGYVSDLVTSQALGWLDTAAIHQPFCLIIGHKATHRTWMPDPLDFGKYDTLNFELPSTFYDDYSTRAAAAQQEMSIDKDMRMGYDLKMFPTIEAMMQDGNFKRMNSAQKDAYLAYYRPIYEEFEKSNLQGKELAEWKYKRYMTDYLNTAESMDRNIGKVLDYLEENGLEDNTIVVYLSDQGFYMGEHGWFDKRFMYEESFRTPMLMRYPNRLAAGSKISANVINVDIAPTLLDLANLPLRDDFQGQSFKNVIEKPSASHRDVLYYHYFENGEHAVSPHFGVRTSQYKLIKFYKRSEHWELFDMENDPNELQNKYNDPKYAKVVKQMKKKLLKEIKKVDDQDALKVYQQDLSVR